MKFNKLILSYLEYQKTSLKPTSYNTLTMRLNTYIKPFFNKNERLPLKVDLIIKFKAYLASLNISTSYKRIIFNELKCMLNYAYRLYDIEPTHKRVKNFSKPIKKPFNVISYNDYVLLRQYFKSDKVKLFFDLLFYGGLRRGEALALTKADIIGDKIQVNKTYTNRQVIETAKTTASNRLVLMPSSLIAELIKISPKDVNERIFSNLSYTSVKRYLDNALKQANLSPLSVHGLRHSHITNLLLYNFTPQEIAKRVGHRDVEELFNTYAETIDAEAKKINNFLSLEYQQAILKKNQKEKK